MKEKHTDLIRDYLLQYMEGFALIGFDTDGEVVAISSGGTPMSEHAVRKIVEDAVNSDCLDVLFPSTLMAEPDFEWVDDDDEDDDGYECE